MGPLMKVTHKSGAPVVAWDGQIMRSFALALILVTLTCAGCAPPLRVPPGGAPIPSTSPSPPWEQIAVNGSLEEVNGVRVLRLWGSRHEMGYAYGFLMANELADVFEQYLFGSVIERLPAEWTYERLVETAAQRIQWPQGYGEEMEAMIQGMETRLGGLPEITHPRVADEGAPMDVTMLALLNAHLDLLGLSRDGCSFAAWGAATADGRVRVGSSWPGHHALLIVRRPADGLSTVCSSSVGSLTCSHGMNELGVIVASQGAEPPQSAVAPCYAGMHARLALEGVIAGPDAIPRIAALFEAHPSCGPSIFLVAQGGDSDDPDRTAAIIEQDRDGVTVRWPSHNEQHDTPLSEAIVATNHFLSRETTPPQPTREESTRRYDGMVAALQQRPPTDLADMQTVLTACDPQEITQSAYLEPDRSTIHVAFAAAFPSPTTFTWEDLFAPLENNGETEGSR